jgi:hypothetical protein
MRSAEDSSQASNPKQTIKIVQADTINGFVRETLLGLPGFHGCGYAAIDEGQVIISADRIRTHTQTEYIFNNYYNYCFKDST